MERRWRPFVFLSLCPRSMLISRHGAFSNVTKIVAEKSTENCSKTYNHLFVWINNVSLKVFFHLKCDDPKDSKVENHCPFHVELANLDNAILVYHSNFFYHERM